MSVWFPLRVRGVYESVEYIDDEFLEPKEYVKQTEEECDELCDKLNQQLQNEIFKATKIIGTISNKYKIDQSFVLAMIQSQLYTLKANG